MPKDSDIAIVGGGLVGLSAALALQNKNRSICVLEAGDSQQSPEPAGLNARSIALSYASVQIFRALGLWQEIGKKAAPIKSIHVSSQGQWGVTRLHAQDYQLPAMGYVIESQHLGKILLDQVSQSKGIKLQNEAEFVSAQIDDRVELSYRRRNKLHKLGASLVLVADGAQSKARTSLGIEHRTIDYHQSAIITNVEVSGPGDAIAYERFTSSGPLAMLPLGGNRYACVWTHDPGDSEALMELDEEQFAASLQSSFGHRLGFIERVGKRHCFPIHRMEAQGLVKHRCLLIGNAANTLHPVAGQGLNLALRDVASLGHLFEDSNISSLELASVLDLLARYEDQRAAEQQQVAQLGDGMVSLFSNHLPVLKQFRAGALGLLDLLPTLKQEVAITGMGFGYQGNPMLRGRMR